MNIISVRTDRENPGPEIKLRKKHLLTQNNCIFFGRTLQLKWKFHKFNLQARIIYYWQSSGFECVPQTGLSWARLPQGSTRSRASPWTGWPTTCTGLTMGPRKPSAWLGWKRPRRPAKPSSRGRWLTRGPSWWIHSTGEERRWREEGGGKLKWGRHHHSSLSMMSSACWRGSMFPSGLSIHVIPVDLKHYFAR